MCAKSILSGESPGETLNLKPQMNPKRTLNVTLRAIKGQVHGKAICVPPNESQRIDLGATALAAAASRSSADTYD